MSRPYGLLTSRSESPGDPVPMMVDTDGPAPLARVALNTIKTALSASRLVMVRKSAWLCRPRGTLHRLAQRRLCQQGVDSTFHPSNGEWRLRPSRPRCRCGATSLIDAASECRPRPRKPAHYEAGARDA